MANNMRFTSVPLAPGVLRTTGLNQENEVEGEETYT